MSKMNLDELSKLAQAYVKAEAAVEAADLALKEAKETARRIREEDIPGAMAELELTKIVLDSGEEISVVPDVSVGILVAERENAYAWLENGGYSGMIKCELSIEFMRNQLPQAEALAERLVGEGFAISITKGVHAGTLKAFVKEQLEKAVENFPMDLFGVRAFKVAKIKPPKVKK